MKRHRRSEFSQSSARSQITPFKLVAADGVREVGDFTLLRGCPPPRGYRFEGQAPTLVGAGPIFQFATEERWPFRDIAELG